LQAAWQPWPCRQPHVLPSASGSSGHMKWSRYCSPPDGILTLFLTKNCFFFAGVS
jgi:hypothetical protein